MVCLHVKFEGNGWCHRLSETGKSVLIGLSVVGFQVLPDVKAGVAPDAWQGPLSWESAKFLCCEL